MCKSPKNKSAGSRGSVQKAELALPPSGEEEEPTKKRKSKNKMPEQPTLTAPVTTAKTTLGHSAAVAARDKAYQEYKRHFESTLASVALQQENQLITEQRWTDSWNSSVEKVKQLYTGN